MDTSDSMHYSMYNNGQDNTMKDYVSPAVNGHSDVSPGPKQQVKKTTQVTVTKHTVQTQIIHSPGGHDPALSPQNYDRPDPYANPRSNYAPDDNTSYRSGGDSGYPSVATDHSYNPQYDPDRSLPYDRRTPSIDGYPQQPREPYDRTYNDTPSDMYTPSVEGSERFGTAPRSADHARPGQGQQPRHGDEYIEPRANHYGYSSPHDHYPSQPPHDEWPAGDNYDGPYDDGYRPDDITREVVQQQMAPLASVDRTGSQDTLEYDDRPSDRDDPQWRTPDLQEIIDYLNHHDPEVVSNAAGYLQHLTYGDDPIKNKTRSLGGIPILVELLHNPTPEIHKCACGALRNISFGKANEENKVAIKDAGGIPALDKLLIATQDPDIAELVTGTLWNLSSSEPLKKPILDDGLSAFVGNVIRPDSGWSPDQPGNPMPSERAWSNTYRNTTGCLRNISSSGLDARKKMRDSPGLVDSLVHIVKAAIATSNMDNKVVENSMCILRNLSFKIANEANHPDAVPAPPTRAASTRAGPPGSPAKTKPDDGSGCFGNKKKKPMDSPTPGKPQTSTLPRGATWDPNMAIPERRHPARGVELLFAHEMVRPYLSLLSECSNHVTLEATTGTLQNISSGEWVWALYIRAQIRKEKGLPVLVELLRMENDKIVSAIARALRNLSLDSRNKELIGKYAMRDLVFRLPSGSVSTGDSKQPLSTDSLVSVLNALHELISKNPENSKSLRDASGIEKLVSIAKSRNKYPSVIVKSAFQVLNTMWSFKELRTLYKQDGWDEAHFIPGVWTSASTKSPGGRSETLPASATGTPGGVTVLEDRTPQRSVSTPASTQAARVDYQASTLPLKSAPSREEVPPPFDYNSYDRRHDDLQRAHYDDDEPQRGRYDPPSRAQDGYNSYTTPAPSERSRDDIPLRNLNYASIDHSNSPVDTSLSRRGPPVGSVAVYGQTPPRDQVVYAKINKGQAGESIHLGSGDVPAGDSWV